MTEFFPLLIANTLAWLDGKPINVVNAEALAAGTS